MIHLNRTPDKSDNSLTRTVFPFTSDKKLRLLSRFELVRFEISNVFQKVDIILLRSESYFQFSETRHELTCLLY